jgi:hypothetical protein
MGYFSRPSCHTVTDTFKKFVVIPKLAGLDAILIFKVGVFREYRTIAVTKRKVSAGIGIIVKAPLFHVVDRLIKVGWPRLSARILNPEHDAKTPIALLTSSLRQGAGFQKVDLSPDTVAVKKADRVAAFFKSQVTGLLIFSQSLGVFGLVILQLQPLGESCHARFGLIILGHGLGSHTSKQEQDKRDNDFTHRHVRSL